MPAKKFVRVWNKATKRIHSIAEVAVRDHHEVIEGAPALDYNGRPIAPENRATSPKKASPTSAKSAAPASTPETPNSEEK